MSDYSQVCSQQELAKVDIHQRPDGCADVRLRKNIKEIHPESPNGAEQPNPGTQWVADEVYLVMPITEEEAEERFDELWEQAMRDSKSIDELLDENSQAANDATDALAELGDVVAEQEAAIAELGDLVASMIGGDK